MMQIIVCEDDIHYAESIQTLIRNWMQATGHMDVEIQHFRSSEDLLERWNKHTLSAHLFLLDIEFPHEMNGMALAREIRSCDDAVPLAFITHYGEYVYDGYTVDALRYLRKPLQQADIDYCLNVAYTQYHELHRESCVLNLPTEKVIIRYSEVLYIEAHSPFVSILTLRSKEEQRVRIRLNQMARKLPPSLFAYCHRSYIVNVSQIRSLRKKELRLCNGMVLPVSEKCVAHLYDTFYKFHQEGYKGT